MVDKLLIICRVFAIAVAITFVAFCDYILYMALETLFHTRTCTTSSVLVSFYFWTASPG